MGMNLRSRAAPRMLAIQSRNVAGTFLVFGVAADPKCRAIDPCSRLDMHTRDSKARLQPASCLYAPRLQCFASALRPRLKRARRVQRRRHGSIEKRSNATERLPM